MEGPEFQPVSRPLISRVTALWLLLGVSVFSVLLVTPALYFVFAGASDAELARVSNIGQAYGVLSTLLSVIALCAVAGSAFYQVRQDRVLRVDAIRSAQRELFGYLIAEPAVFGPCITDTSKFSSEEEARRYFFSTLYISYAMQGYETGYYGKGHLRAEFASPMFRSAVARDLWQERLRALREQVGEGSVGPVWGIFEEERAKFVPATDGYSGAAAEPPEA
jgi:uncharacterized protein DUF6082